MQHFTKMSAAQVAASPFTLKGTLIEMTGIDTIDLKEVTAGVYRLTIWLAKGADFMTATLPAAQAHAAKHAKSLIVAVRTPDGNPVELAVLGNATTHEGLSTVPVPVWK